jgi:hypothetical protein
MALGYKYVQKDLDNEIDWIEVGKNLSGVLLEEKRVREEKIATIDEITRESYNNLANAPKGQNQDVNNVLSNYTSDIQQQMFLDDKLLRSGKMDPKLWTLRRQNYKDGTDKVFKIGTVLQENSKTIMDGINNNEIQNALGLHNMGSIESLGNLNNIRITTNALADGKLGVAKYDTKIINGQEVRVLSKDNTPVDVLMNMIHYQPKKFDVDANTTATAKAFGSRFQAIYQAATTAGAGTISEFLGTQAMDTTKYPQLKGVVDEMNRAIDLEVGSYLSTNLNIVSVLGDNTGNYNSDSFTYDKNVAAKDPKKILLKIDPRTQTPIMDEDAPNFDKQKKEASDWLRTNLMSKLDSESKITPTAQLRDETFRPSAGDRAQDALERDSQIFGETVAKATTSNNLAVKSASIRALDGKLQGTGYRLINNPVGFDKGIYIYNEANPSQSINTTKENDPDASFIALESGINSILQEKDRGYLEDKAVRAGRKKLGKKVTRISTGSTRQDISKKTYKPTPKATGVGSKYN